MKAAVCAEFADRSGGPNACWPWMGQVRADGYGTAPVKEGGLLAHRFMWLWEVGAIPRGHDLDHECHNVAAEAGDCPGGPCEHRRCVNPAHLRPLTRALHRPPRATNRNLAKTHCPQGHEYTPENTTRHPSRPGSRICRACNNGGRRGRRRSDEFGRCRKAAEHDGGHRNAQGAWPR